MYGLATSAVQRNQVFPKGRFLPTQLHELGCLSVAVRGGQLVASTG